MYHPTTRLLTILELLQTHPHMSGDELARRLEVETRTVRRYILMLQEMGIPVEGNRGPGGGYRLRPGYRLPPLLFTEEEATAVILGLLGSPWLQVDLSSTSIEGALAKVYRVLPLQGRERLQAISSHMILTSYPQESRPDAALLVNISDSIQQRRRIAIDYSSYHNESTHREIEPYGLVGWKGQWYIVARCCLRQDFRTFRLDRIHNPHFLPDTFTRDETFDCQAYVTAHLTSIPARWQIEVEFQAELYLVQHKIPSTYGSLTPTATGVLFHTHHNDLPTFARYLVNLDLPFTIHNPPELRAALLHLAQQLTQIATTDPSSLSSS